ncbi:MAG: hypothetical protein AAB322_04170 [Pseudomonadota bacterium]
MKISPVFVCAVLIVGPIRFACAQDSLERAVLQAQELFQDRDCGIKCGMKIKELDELMLDMLSVSEDHIKFSKTPLRRSIGIYLDEDLQTIQKMYFHGPAWKSRLKSGDRILRVNGKFPAPDRSVSDMIDAAGDEVSLFIRPAGSSGEPVEIVFVKEDLRYYPDDFHERLFPVFSVRADHWLQWHKRIDREEPETVYRDGRALRDQIVKELTSPIGAWIFSKWGVRK